MARMLERREGESTRLCALNGGRIEDLQLHLVVDCLSLCIWILEISLTYQSMVDITMRTFRCFKQEIEHR